MSDDSDLLIAAAATAAVFTWMGSRARSRSRTAGARDWHVLMKAIRAGVLRSWRECPAYLFITGIRDAFIRRK
jgi:hypothetical protein